MMYMEWIQQLSAGDEVFVSERIGLPRKGKVTRLTKTQIFVTTGKLFSGNANELAFHKKNGRSVGGNIWNGMTLLCPTDEIREEAEISALKNKATKMLESISIPKTKTEILELIELLSKFSKAS